MMPDHSAPRIPQQRREIYSVTPGGNSRNPEPFQCRRGGTREALTRGRRRSEPVVTIHRELVIGGLLLAAVTVVACGLWWVGRGQDRPQPGTVAKTVVERQKAAAPTAIVWEGPIPAEVVEKFTRATTHAQRLRWVRDAETVGPAMEAFFRDGPGATEKIMATRPVAESADGDMLYEVYQVTMERGGPRLVCVSVDPEGAKVDFKAYARHGSESWDDLLSGEVLAAEEVRVFLRPGGFFQQRFSDEEKWLHFQATTPDLPDSLDFYVARDSPAAVALAREGDTIGNMTVSIRAVDDSAKSGQFEITALKASGWIEPEE